jgi:hypothetical protein
MASPDWTEYVDLSVYDVDAEDIFDDAIEYARNRLPDWVPEAGNVEVILLEAIATEAANVVQAVNRVPGATTETLLKLFGVERSDGDLATATIQVVAINTNGYTIPGGSSFAYFPPDGRTPLVYTTDDDLIIPNGSATGSVSVTAQAVGTSYNEPSQGAALQLLDTVPYIRSSAFLTAPSGGASAEDDDTFFQRAINTLRSYSAALTTPDQIQAHVLVNYPDVYRCKVYDKNRAADRDTTDPSYVPNAHVGYSLVVVAGQNSNPTDTSDTQLSVALREEIQEDLNARVNPGLVVEVVNAEIVDVVVDVSVKRLDGYSSIQVQAAISATVADYLSANNWEWETAVREYELAALVDGVEGVDYVIGVNDISTDSGSATYDGANLNLDVVGTLTTPIQNNFVITVT